MESIYLIIAITFFGFIGLAFVLLFPVYRFLRRQEEVSDDWTPDAIARRQRTPPPPNAPAGPSGDGASEGPPPDLRRRR